ncbi:MAG: hypothetical protein MRJ93_03070 [Nitrososphaeraceae archaeon]|nr:hypothetical protein [Nitrososphaeraceae archaeon]
MISKKNAVLLTLVSTTFLFAMVAYALPQTQQAFAQGFFDQQQAESDVSDSQASSASNATSSSTITPTETAEVSSQETSDQKLILGDITIPIDADTTLSLEMPDSKITVTPNR